jgi:uncharacterized protein
VRTFFDSSAFAKRYIKQEYQPQVEQLCIRASVVGLSVICVPEMISALNRRVREGDLPWAEYQAVKQALREDMAYAEVVDLSAPVLTLTLELLENQTLRAMDALHVASAMVWQADLFVSADRRQLAAAVAVGLQTMMV